MAFNKERIRSTYSSDEDSLLNDFYIPHLRDSVKYDRAVGYFSASMLAYAGQGLSQFVSNEGEMRLIFGHPVASDEFDAIQQGENLRYIYSRLNEGLEHTINEVPSELFSCRLDLLSWLVATNRLRIKYAFRPKGMYHEKIGIFKDDQGNKIVFQGSANETKYALLPDFNFESISVYPSWQPEIFRAYGATYEERFERLWNDQVKQTKVLEVPSEYYSKLSALYSSPRPPPEDKERIIYEYLFGLNRKPNELPIIPKYLGGLDYNLKRHQKRALENWKANQFKGIFALATGAGKTITALHAITSLAIQQKHLAMVVAVPYQNLADQWCEVMELFSIDPIKCYIAKKNWVLELESGIADFNLKIKPFIAIVVVNKTLSSKAFQERVNGISPDKLFMVGDECHHHSTKTIIKSLPDAKFKIGLSATPWSANEDEKQKTLTSYYGSITAEYPIKEAINDGVLTQYKYFAHRFYLTLNETEEYKSLSKQIAKLSAIRQNNGHINEELFRALCMKRARLIGSADKKFQALKDVLIKLKIDKHTLFYCGDGSVVEEGVEEELKDISVRDIERVSQLVHELGWKSSQFTANESLRERKWIIDNFKHGIIDAMVSIRVLDEGIDIPSCKTAFLLASSRNERQFIQRRGRILRKSPGKEFAVIHDFIALPDIGYALDGSLKNLVDEELNRVYEFAHVALNKNDIFSMAEDISSDYGLDWLSKLGR